MVVRDRSLAALTNPGPHAMRGFGSVSYLHHSEVSRLPDAHWYIFNLERLDEHTRTQIADAVTRGAQVAVFLRQIDPEVIEGLGKMRVHILPAYGVAEHIGEVTARRALRLAFRGQLVGARGFLENSMLGPVVPGGSFFVRLLRQASEEARQGEAVVAAVLAPRRTGSQFLRDLIGWHAGAAVRVFHEHGIPDVSDGWPVSRSLPDALADEPNPTRHRGMRRKALRSLITSARRRYVFVTDREPRARVISLFVKRHSRWLREQFDHAIDEFRDQAGVQRVFDAWLPDVLHRHTEWHRRWCFEAFGVDVRQTTPTDDGLLVGESGDNTLVIVPIERLDAIRAACEDRYGAGTCAALDHDSAQARGDAPVMAAVRRQIQIPRAAIDAMNGTPEVAHIREHVARLSGAGA